MDSQESLPILNAIEIRVLGSLIEKSITTPDYYPMTINAITAACNQKTSRHPIVQYDDEMVINALNLLKKVGLISTAIGGTSRSIKYKHNFSLVFPLSAAELAVMCLLFLRGPLTAGELNSNSGRLHEFELLEEVFAVLESLTNRERPFIKQLPKRPGQKEVRYIHLMGDSINFNDTELAEENIKSAPELETRLAIVEQELAELKISFEKLMKELMG